MCRRRRCLVLYALCLVPLALPTAAARAQGFVLGGVGPVNRSMGGAATAAPLDSLGALYWNPATISGLPSSELDFATDLLYPRSTTSSSVPANALGPGVPPALVSGKTRDEAGVFPLPAGGFVYRPADSPWTFGLGIFPAGGFGTNYPGTPSNPIFSPLAPNGMGVGPVTSELLVLQVVPTAAWQLTDRLSVGFSPVVSLTRLTTDPGLVFTPDDPDRDGVPHYPALTHTRYHWGGGFQVGLYYLVNEAWRLGASFKSPVWFEPFRYHSSDELGNARNLKLGFDYPLIVSVGTAYTGFERLLVALDLRYIDYKDTRPFGAPAGFDPTGAVTGLGWNSVFVTALGAQYQLTDSLALRAGYTFNTNPIPGRNTFFNVVAPLTFQHQLAVGASYRLTQNCLLSAAYYHVFENPITGPIYSPAGPIPGTSVTTGTVADALGIGISVLF